MKSNITIALLLIGFATFAQIKTGIYKASSKDGGSLLKLNNDKTYEITFFYGIYEQVGDTIYLNNNEPLISNFSIKKSKEQSADKSVKLNFLDDEINYYVKNLYIGIQKGKNAPVDYKCLADYSNMDLNTFLYPKQFSIELEKGDHLNLVDARTDPAVITQFYLDPKINEYDIDYNAYVISNLKLKGFYDINKEQLVISDGKLPVLFSFDKLEDIKKDDNQVTALKIIEENGWLEKAGFSNIKDPIYLDKMPETDSLDQVYSSTRFKFKYTIQDNFKDALKFAEKNPEKILVVAFDLKNKNYKTDFDLFIKDNQSSLSNYMYDAYRAEYDKYNFYMATEKDKSILDKLKIKLDKVLLFFNSQGELLYHSSTTLNEKQYDYFNGYNTLFPELEKVNTYIKLDQVITLKNATAAQIIEALKNSLKLEQNFDSDMMVVPAPLIPEDMVEKNITDTAVAEAIKYDYSIIKDKQNLYTLKTTEASLQIKWAKIIESFLEKNTYDKDFVTIAKAEIANVGFSNKLYNNRDQLLKETDFKVLDYFFKNFKNIKSQDSISTLLNGNYESIIYESPINNVLNDFFYNNTNSYGNPEKKQLSRIMDNYERYVKISNNNFYVLQNYLIALKQTLPELVFNEKYVKQYDAYFNEVIKKDGNLIESLDYVFSNSSNNNYSGWNELKNYFANLANEVSWHVVQTSNDKNYISKAILWSETSLKLTKNTHYYLDTLAQLYYKNGEQEKAISLEAKALILGKGSEYESEYKSTLEKMKNGTY